MKIKLTKNNFGIQSRQLIKITMGSKEIFDAGDIDSLPTEDMPYNLVQGIRDTWAEGKKNILNEVVPGNGGVSGAVLRILSSDTKVQKLVLDGKSQFVSPDQCRKYLKKVAKLLGAEGDSIGLGTLLDVLNVPKHDRKVWEERVQGHMYRQR
ncbi:hypothetical protein H7170_03545 [Candidatus Gracilibacteria bacterium]|nr:hypothetical protein [Candidatus Gracilibacteria bacterium]